MWERQQGGQQRQGIGLGKAIVAQRVLEFLQLDGGRILARKLQPVLQVVDDGIQRTVLVIGRAAKLHASRPLVRKLLFEFLHQPGFANARLATEQYHLPSADFRLVPALPQYSQFYFAANKRREAGPDRDLKAALGGTLVHDTVQWQRSGQSLDLVEPTLLTLEQPFDQAVRR